jgi:hypothetical protein
MRAAGNNTFPVFRANHKARALFVGDNADALCFAQQVAWNGVVAGVHDFVQNGRRFVDAFVYMFIVRERGRYKNRRNQ